MKPFKVFFLAALCIIQTAFLTYPKANNSGPDCFAAAPDSDNSPIGPSLNSPGKNDSTKVQKDTISENPTINEINNLFQLATNGRRDPFRIIALVSSRKDNSVPGLNAFLFTDNMKIKDSTVKITANKQYAVYALDAIGSAAAEELLINAAGSHPDINIRGLALNTVACNFYYRLKNNNMSAGSNSLTPDKEIVHIMLENADDPTPVPCRNEALGKIAREGIKNWTGLDYGDLPNQKNLNVNSMNASLSMKAYREQWWQNNNSKLNWNSNTGHFEIN
jgi:hypothetical protein